MTMAARDTPDRRAGREPARRPLTWFDSPEEQALIAPWNAGRGAPLADVRHAAEQGHDAAQHALAYRHEHGDGVPQDFAEAARWYRRAAELDNAIALNILGLLYCYGDGVERHVATAARTFRASAWCPWAVRDTQTTGQPQGGIHAQPLNVEPGNKAQERLHFQLCGRHRRHPQREEGFHGPPFVHHGAISSPT